MLEVALFLGFPVDRAYARSMEAVDPTLLELFFHNSNDCDYLSEVTNDGVRYLGKYAGENNRVADIALLQNNIYSILKKLIPDYTYETVPLILFPTEKNS